LQQNRRAHPSQSDGEYVLHQTRRHSGTPRGSGSLILDRAILERVAQREAKALDLFFECFFDRVYGYTRAVVPDSAVADDLVQTAFLRLHQSIERIDPARDPSPWVFTIVNNVIRDHWRSAGRHSRREKPIDATDEFQNDDADPIEKLIGLEDVTRLEKAFDQLSSGDRQILWLRNIEQLSLLVIATMLEISHDVARQRHVRAMRRLAAAFKKLTVGNEP
jgi:RNA polymerase sigma factor (sigma-70 family)